PDAAGAACGSADSLSVSSHLCSSLSPSHSPLSFAPRPVRLYLHPHHPVFGLSGRHYNMFHARMEYCFKGATEDFSSWIGRPVCSKLTNNGHKRASASAGHRRATGGL